MTSEEKIRSAVTRLEQDAHNAIAVHAILMGANDSSSLHEAMGRSPATQASNVIYTTLEHKLLIILVRMHDPVGSERASLPSVFGMLERRGTIPDRIRDRWTDFSTRWATRLVPLRKFRNQYLAHLLYGVPPAEPERGDLDDLLEATLELVALLGELVAGRTIDFEDSRWVWRTCSTQFWSFVEAGTERRRSGRERIVG